MGKEDGQPEALRQTLQDAGCDEKTVERYLDLEREGRTQEQLRLLAVHRRLLLEAIHSRQRQIDCLDYLVFQMEREARVGVPMPARKKTTNKERF